MDLCYNIIRPTQVGSRNKVPRTKEEVMEQQTTDQAQEQEVKTPSQRVQALRGRAIRAAQKKVAEESGVPMKVVIPMETHKVDGKKDSRTWTWKVELSHKGHKTEVLATVDRTTGVVTLK
jgi:hypothetical protein